MNESTVLDFVELRASSPTSRCELHISAEDRTEKLACGFLKTFLSHVRAAQELYAAGAGSTLRLEGPHVFNGNRRPWFTKGTLERFIQYVSTPEVLERVKTIEDELVQLEQVRSIQAGNLPQVHDTFLSSDATVLRAGLMPPEYHVGHFPYNNAENSKRELLRAMDVRLSALHQEQDMAFCRATAAGFDVDSIEDLLAFSEFFGADHLRVACNWFYELYLKRERAADELVHHNRSQELKSQPSLPSEEMERGASLRALHSDSTDDGRGVKMPVMDKTATSHCPSPLDELSPVRPHGYVSKGFPQRTSPRRRSASPLKKVQLGRFGSRRAGSVVIRSINYFSERQSKERNQAMDTSSSDSEDNTRSYVLDEPSYAMRSPPAAARRLSVQAAINLFESKQSKEVGEGQGKKRSVKPQSRRGSLDGASSSISWKLDLKQYGEEDGDFGSVGWQEMGVVKPDQELDFSYDSCGSRINPILRSSNKCAEHVATGIDSEEVSFHQGGRLQNGKQASLSKAGLNLRRGSSTSDDFVASELDSVGGSPIAGRTLELADSDFSNARSTITSLSQSDAYTEKNLSVLKLLQSTPTSLASSGPVALYESQCNQGSTSQKLYQAASVLNVGSNCGSKDNASKDCAMPSDLSIQALASLAHSPSSSEETSGTHEGRLYEHYRKLRDAKMMEEQQSKRAEREAKLRLMEETLDLRKAEMDARTAKLNKDSPHAKTRAAKLLALKANLRDFQRVQEDGVTRNSKIQAVSTKDKLRSDSSPPSPPLTPRVVKEQALTPKLHRGKKAVATSQKSATTPRSSTRAVSVSPKTTPRGTAGKVSSQWTPASSNVSENSLACSVPCFSDLKKENAKPSPGKSSGSTKKGGAAAQPSATSRASILESNGSVPLQNSSSNRTTKVEKKNRGRHSRQSLPSSEPKDLSTTPEDEVSMLINIQKDLKMEAPAISKIRRSALAPIQEARPFLRKGTGIGPGAGPGVMKLKAEAVKSSDEDAPGTPLKASDEEVPALARNIRDTSDGEGMLVEGMGADVSAFPFSYASEDKREESQAPESSEADVTHHSDGGFFAPCEEGKLAEPCRDDELFENERACHTISFPIDFGIHERYAGTFAPEPDSVPQVPREEVARREGEVSATLSQLLLESANPVMLNEPSVNGSASFRANLATEENNASRFSPMKAASLASSSLKRLGAAIPDYFSPSSAATIVDSPPIGSPASWNSSQVQYASESDITRTQKKLGSSHKHVVVIVPPKEPARGFKRLLKFGRKSRAAPEIIITDGVSASTPSEGDDDMEEVHREVNMRSAHDMLRKVKLQERLFKDYGIANVNGINGSNVDKGPVQSLQTSIPIPPSNFQLKYDHAPGSSKLKAPRSFFSLSTFRSRGGEGKSR